MAPSVWRQIQKSNFNNLRSLAEFLEIDPQLLGSRSRFPLNIPRRLASKITKNSLTDPLLKQFVPLKEEDERPLGFVDEPVQDSAFCKSKNLLQKYQGRVLLIATSACAMHCRYCFRQNFAYTPNHTFAEELEIIRSDPTLQEVILSGGDPLSLSDQVLGELLEHLSMIDHIRLIRFHTRFPMGIPERIDVSFLDILRQCKKQIFFVIHANHPQEFDPEVLAALKSVQLLGIPVLLQAILLKGVNDQLSTLKSLFELCVYNGIVPYYLHQLDKVAGAAHFEVSEEIGLKLLEELRACLPGYAVPRFVQEIPGEPGKTIIS